MSEIAKMDGKKRLYVEKIKNGTVIDHINRGLAFAVLKILGFDGEDGGLITIGINVKSNSSTSGKKDIIKFEGKRLEEKHIHQISVISPNCIVSFIENYDVVEKFVVELPELIKGVIDCPNERCITNVEREPVVTEFKVLENSPLKVACTYCERIVYKEEIMKKNF
jgi:aspartate carbamoyltransferase regulatory subunit